MEAGVAEARLLRTDIFRINGHEVPVSLTDTGIEWRGDSKSRKGTIEWADILCVTPIPASCRKPKGAAATLHYISRPSGKWEWRHTSVTFSVADEAEATGWVERVKSMMLEKVPQRVKNLMVFVNPKSGGCKGVKIYENKAAPIFKLAGVNTHVIVTERAHHAVEVLSKSDLSPYDGFVAVGGDGTLTEVFAGLSAAARTQHGVDPNDPDGDIPYLDYRVGLIPAGTGQGMIVTSTGSKSIESATLHIIYGEVWDVDLTTVHSGRNLLYTGFLLSGYGFFGEAIRLSESNRQMGRLRYMYGMGKAAANVKRFKVNVDILVKGANGRPPEWIRRSGEDFVNVFHMMFSPDYSKNYSGALHVYLEKPASGLKPVKFFVNLIARRLEDVPPFIEYFEALSYKVTPFTADGDSSGEAAEASVAGVMPYDTVNIDGESFKLPVPEYVARVHPKRVKMFGAYYRYSVEEKAKRAASSTKR